MKKQECPKCSGTGWVIVKKENREVAQRCDCRKTGVFQSRIERANLPQRFDTVKLDDFYPDKNNPTQLNAKKMVKSFIEDYPAVSGGLLLQGEVGVGKTKLLCTIATELFRRQESFDIFYIDWNDLIRQMRSGEDSSSRDFEAINLMVQRLISVDLLLFDEVGASRMSPWVLDNIYYIFNKRYNHEKITVCATNYYDKPMDKRETLSKRIGERIRSRLFEMTQVVEITGKDLRRF